MTQSLRFQQNAYLILSAITMAEAYAVNMLPHDSLTLLCKYSAVVASLVALNGACHSVEERDHEREFERSIERDLESGTLFEPV
jgi:hypothetical protein